MAEVFHDDDADLSVVQSRHVAVLGYGDAGQAHALTLRDSGVDVRVGLPEASPNRPAAEAEGLRVVPPYEACEEADLVVVLAPHHVQPRLYAEAIEPNLIARDTLLFGQGWAIYSGDIVPPGGVDVCLVASTSPGSLLRAEYGSGRGVPVLVAVEEDASGSAWPLTLSYARALGGTRAGAIGTTFAEEAVTGLFAELAVRGGMQQMLQAGVQTLVEAGHQPEVAALSCLPELPAMTAPEGGETTGPSIVADAVRAAMREVLDEITRGSLGRRSRTGADTAERW